MGNAWQIHDQKQAYFVTFQVVGWADVFTRVAYRKIILDHFKYCRKNRGLLLYAYVIMSNHVHAIMQSENGDLSGIIRDFKKFSSRKIMSTIRSNEKERRKEWLDMIFEYHAKYNKRNAKHQFWTHFNHAIELNNERVFNNTMEYIHQNPVKAGIVDSPEEYLYSSARNYSDREALIEIDEY